MLVVVVLLLCSSLCSTDYVSSWNCTTLNTKSLRNGITWNQLNCTGFGYESSWIPPFDPKWEVGPMLFNVIKVTLNSPGVDVIPSSAPLLSTIPEMGNKLKNAVAGINGGYFFRLDVSTFIDDVCILKTAYDAKQPVSPLVSYNYGVGDSLLIVNHTLLSYNCHLLGYEAPVALILDGRRSSIQVLAWGTQLDPNQYANVIGAGPRLVVVGADGSPEVNIPYWDFNVNIWEHAANTAVGLVGKENDYDFLLMVTADGSDACARDDPSCGIEAEPMGYFMKDYLGASAAMGMDQGGSTTCWVKGEPNNGLVSNSDCKNPNSSPRAVWDGLFVTFSE